MKKKCPKCKRSKKLDCFYGGGQSWCKKCQGDRYKNDKNYRKKFIEGRKKYLKTEQYKKLHRKDSFLNWIRNRKKVIARQKVYYALKTGKLERKRCEVCGDSRVQAHHKNYNKPYEVEWLCIKDHRIADGKYQHLKYKK